MLTPSAKEKFSFDPLTTFPAKSTPASSRIPAAQYSHVSFRNPLHFKIKNGIKKENIREHRMIIYCLKDLSVDNLEIMPMPREIIMPQRFRSIRLQSS